jgi:ABC-type lipoprotein export system ATPase subunit
MQGRTTLLVSHDPAVVAHADRVVRLEDGRVLDPPAVAA